MKPITCDRLALLTFIPVLIGFGYRSALAQEGIDARHLHVLVVADTNDATIGTHADADRRHIVTALEEGIPEIRRTITVLTGNRVSPDGVLDELRRMDVQPSDALAFYYAGHGSWDERYGHVLTMSAGGLSRRTLVENLREKRAALTVILTDCCSIYSTLSVVPKVKARPDHDVLRYLFFRHRGFVDITSSRKGTYSYGDANGGIFSIALKECLYSPLTTLDANQDQVVEWREFAEALNQKTQSKFQVLVARDRRIGTTTSGQSGQVPEVFGELARLTGGPIPGTR